MRRVYKQIELRPEIPVLIKIKFHPAEPAVQPVAKGEAGFEAVFGKITWIEMVLSFSP